VRWIDEFHVDGLRLDAVHAIVDDSDTHFLSELSVRARAAAPDRRVHLVLENEENQSRRLERDTSGQPVAYTAQWNDDVHHVLHTAATGESAGYYRDFAGDTEKLGRALAEGFAFQGEVMHFRGWPRGGPGWGLRPGGFVAFIENHDQIGNRARGERLNQLASREARRAVAAVYLLLPQIPMLFMGEEWDANTPFPFFCDFEGDLAEAIRKGRREEFAHLPEFADSATTLALPDPLDVQTFESARLNWNALATSSGSEWYVWYQQLLATRHAHVVPMMEQLARGGTRYLVRGHQAVTVQWLGEKGVLLELNANLSAQPVTFSAPEGRTLWLEGSQDERHALQPWSVQWLVVNI
jgi:maltooligosyltrehalose trehalohydrolase